MENTLVALLSEGVTPPTSTSRRAAPPTSTFGGVTPPTSIVDVPEVPARSDSAPLCTGPSPSKRQPSSLSWSEGVEGSQLPLSPRASSYTTLPFLEHLPPLLSYDEGDGLGRSPSLRDPGGILSEQEQLNLMARMSEQSSSESESTATPTPEDEGGEDDREPTLRLSEESGEEEEQEQTPDHHVMLEQSQSVLEEDTSAAIPASPQLEKGGSPLIQRTSAPLPSHTPSSSPAIGRKKILFTPANNTPSPVGRRTVREEGEVYNSPSFIFLQLYHSPMVSNPLTASPGDTPLLLPTGEAMDRSLKVLDHIPPYDTHKIGVIFVDREQTQEQQILSNVLVSSRYLEFLRGLGQLLCLADCPPEAVYLGGLDRSGTDGQFAYFYQDHVTQVIFHVATLMPTHTSDPHCNNKKLHIGNDFVTIVYNDSQQPYTFGTIKGQFNFAEVLIEPLAGSMNRVSVRTKKGLQDLPHCEPRLISDTWLPVLARHKALQANLASLVHMSESGSIYGGSEQYPSNWLGRLRSVQRIREKCLADRKAMLRPNSPSFHDFTDYS